MFGRDCTQEIFVLQQNVHSLKRCVELQASVIGQLHEAFNDLFDKFAQTHGYVAKTSSTLGSSIQWLDSPRRFATITEVRPATTIPEGHPK